ncbi:MAG: hypothetical protein L0Y66_09405 [Myxococcaceae bacterium]|nr:hypothetical protein [Myxococcaceae bacterium]MCI0673930.1 hypothetical protein [Myxococcaceae bacterium]
MDEQLQPAVRHRQLVAEVRTTCAAMLAGTLDLVSGCTRLAQLRHESGGEEFIPLAFVAYDSELDGVPDPSRYHLWEPAALHSQLRKLDAYRDDILRDTETLLAAVLRLSLQGVEVY